MKNLTISIEGNSEEIRRVLNRPVYAVVEQIKEATIAAVDEQRDVKIDNQLRVYRIEDNGDIVLQDKNGCLGTFTHECFDYAPTKGAIYDMYVNSHGDCFFKRVAYLRTTIEIDCDPWHSRQKDMFRYICKNILDCEYFEPISKCFGNWVWKVNYKSLAQRDEVEKYLREAYDNGCCRYASW